jgi:hypothetical protein
MILGHKLGARRRFLYKCIFLFISALLKLLLRARIMRPDRNFCCDLPSGVLLWTGEARCGARLLMVNHFCAARYMRVCVHFCTRSQVPRNEAESESPDSLIHRSWGVGARMLQLRLRLAALAGARQADQC